MWRIVEMKSDETQQLGSSKGPTPINAPQNFSATHGMHVHMAAVSVYGNWEAFEWEMAKVIVSSRRVNGLEATWIARSDQDPNVAFLFTVWETAEKMAAHWSSEFYRTEIVPKLVPRVIGEIPNWSGAITSLYSRLPPGYRRRSHR
jgi:quinol monooxygenase YgiN